MFVTPDGPRIVQAASLALAIMKTTKADWATSRQSMPASIVLSSEQADLLEEFSEQLLMVAPAAVEGVDRMVTIYACPECGRYGYAEGAAPKNCNLKLWCTGQMVKASAATKAA